MTTIKIVNGERANILATQQVEAQLRGKSINGTLYFGYPVIPTVDDSVTVDALLASLEHGIVLFDLPANSANLSDDELSGRQDDLYAALFKKLLDYKELRHGRSLIVDIQVVTIVSSTRTSDQARSILKPDELLGHLIRQDPISADKLKRVNAAIQRMASVRPPSKRTGVVREDSRGSIIERIEREIANLDEWQNWAAIEMPSGPQRIRGLAGSGKTVVLALKASYLHAQHPDWNIAFTFQTRALYPHLRELIRRFTYDQLGHDPDWTKLRVLHAWGTAREPGFYSEAAKQHDVPIRDFRYASSLYGFDHAFEGVCNELLEALRTKEVRPIFDAILIDEGQDLPRPFFEIAYRFASQNKRIVWAYDELQNLGSYRMAPPAELFGNRLDGTPTVPNVDNADNSPKSDIVLPVCYRNTPWALVIAHALGLGVYRKEKRLVQYFEEPSIWHDIGYEVRTGALEPGAKVTLRRRTGSYPAYFEANLNPEDAVATHCFEDSEAESKWVADAIRKNILDDELDARDILVIFADPYSVRTEAPRLIQDLAEHDIAAHVAGITTSRDYLFEDGSIAISSIYRAKGNEAPMVYIMGADACLSTDNPAFRRNILFTAITRSRAWVRITGCGDRMRELEQEVAQVAQCDYMLEFKVPTPDELRTMRRIHRDTTPAGKKHRRNIEAYLGQIAMGELTVDEVPPEFRIEVTNLLDELARRRAVGQ
jgi:superfamily I DNA and RNA helicase